MPAAKDEDGGGEAPGGPAGDSLAFSKEVDDLAYLKSKTKSDWVDSDEEEEGEEGEEEDEEEDGSGDEEEGEEGGGKGKGVGKKQAGSKGGTKSASVDKDEGEEGSDGGDEAEAGEDAMQVDDPPEQVGGGEEEEEEDEAVTGRLFVRNLAFAVTEDDLRRTFGKFGELAEVHLCTNKETKRPNGLAFILYLIPQHAAEAKAKLDGKFLQGRLLHIIAGKMPKRKDAEEEEGEEGKGGFKKKREQRLKDGAGSSHNWNMLFMRQDTVADAAAVTPFPNPPFAPNLTPDFTGAQHAP